MEHLAPAERGGALRSIMDSEEEAQQSPGVAREAYSA
jgi:hypothetical protein